MHLTPQVGSLQELAARIEKGDAGAEEDFFRLFEGRVRAFAIANSGDRDLADDLVQEALWAVIRALRNGQVRQPDQLTSFIFGTARNLLNDRLRSRGREKLDQLSQQPDIARADVEQRRFERHHAACQAIRMLEPHERAVLLLTLVDGLGAEEVAARLGITPESVRQRKSRAIRKLSGILAASSQNPAPRLLRSIDM